MTREEMLEMMEFYEFYKAMKSSKIPADTVSARNDNTKEVTLSNNTPLSIESGRYIQRGNDVVDLGENKNISDVATKFEMYEQDVDGKKYYCIRSGMCTGKKVIDKVTGQEQIKKFNIAAKKLANDMIKAVDDIITLEIPFENKKGCWKAWGFKTKKKALEAIENLPKVVKGEDVDKANQEYFAKRGGKNNG